MKKLGEIFDNLGIKYTWYVFTNDTNAIPNPNIVYKKPDLDITSWIAKADFLIQLSSCEAFCFSVVEALKLGIPVIVTDLPVYKELGLDKTNSIKLKLDFEDIDKDLLFKDYKFKYEEPANTWGKLLATGKNTYYEERKKKYLVKATPLYLSDYPRKKIDKELDRTPKENETWTVTFERLQELLYENRYDAPLVEVVKEIS